jgi:hypothetical protein
VYSYPSGSVSNARIEAVREQDKDYAAERLIFREALWFAKAPLAEFRNGSKGILKLSNAWVASSPLGSRAWIGVEAGAWRATAGGTLVISESCVLGRWCAHRPNEITVWFNFMVPDSRCSDDEDRQFAAPIPILRRLASSLQPVHLAEWLSPTNRP